MRTWLTRILLNKTADHFRASGREASMDARESQDGTDGIDAFFRANGRYVEPPQPWRNPDDALTQGRFYDVLEHCWRRVRAADRGEGCPWGGLGARSRR